MCTNGLPLGVSQYGAAEVRVMFVGLAYTLGTPPHSDRKCNNSGSKHSGENVKHCGLSTTQHHRYA